MKRVFLFLSLLVSLAVSYAQVELEKGAKLQQVGGRLNIGLSEPTLDVGVNLTRGWFVLPKLVVGPIVEVGYMNDAGDGYFSFNAGGFTRAYVGQKDARTLFFGQASVGLGVVQDPFFYMENNFSTTLSVGPGVSFRVGQNVMLDLSLPFRSIIVSDDDTYHSVNGTFGVSMLLPSRK